ncbi:MULTISPECIES: hypothetical protein [Halomonas]|uniref:hypothetical protein n=1 Tax=Halomonas TaxID=2745 RepID=UPI001CE4471D|nr:MULTISPECIES: hypothetical protein [Halomonas]
MRLIQFVTSDKERAVGLVSDKGIEQVNSVISTRELALDAIRGKQTIVERVNALGLGEIHDYDVLIKAGRVLPPLDHPDAAHCILYLAHAKLRHCSYGPELRVGELPSHLKGTVRIRRNGYVFWEKSFPTGEDNMSHSIANLEYHHFKYNQFLRSGDVHVQFLGTSVASQQRMATSLKSRFQNSVAR